MPSRVPLHMKRIGLGVAVLAIGGVIWYLQRPGGSGAKAASASPIAQGATAGTAEPGTAAKPKPFDRVTKLSSLQERQQIADRIANAPATRAATHARPVPRLPGEAAEDAPPMKTQIRAAMKEVIPFITECYERAIPTLASPNFDLTAEFMLVGDPDVGTLVDVKSLVDGDGKALSETLDECFKNALQLLALPPLEEGDILVRYPFKFSLQ